MVKQRYVLKLGRSGTEVGLRIRYNGSDSEGANVRYDMI